MVSGLPTWRLRRRLSEIRLWRFRSRVLGLLVLLLFGVLLLQLWKLQVVHGASYRERAEHNRLRLVSIPAPRGVIFDRQGRPLVRNVPSFTIALVLADLPVARQGEVSANLARLLGLREEEITALIEKARREQRLFEPLPLARGVPKERALILEERQAEFPGVLVLAQAQRHYLSGALTAAVLGYLGVVSAEEYPLLQRLGYGPSDRLGKAGVEGSYERELQGTPGREQVEVSAYGRTVRTLAREEPQAGQNLILGLDLDLQRSMEQHLREAMGGSEFAAAVAVDPMTGELLGLVSLPTFDNNLFEGSSSGEQIEQLLQDPRRPLLNYAIGGAAPPGSTFKLITGSAALQERVATSSTTIVSTGQIVLTSIYDPSVTYVFKDWAAHGALDFYRGIARSSDVYFYYLAGGYGDFVGLGVERLARYARAFGFDAPLGIDLPGEIGGIIPDPAWKEAALGEPWFIGDTYNMGIGQGFLAVTPLQLVMAAAAIANGGELLQPQVVREVRSPEGEVLVPFTKKVIRKVSVDPAHLAVMRRAMQMVVEPGGTATLAQVPGVAVAGKTGTAEFGLFDSSGVYRRAHGWFVAFAPVEKPRIALVVFLQEGQGALTAAPTAGKILRDYFGVQPQPTVARAP